jgi:O-antigen/teichoic acid export membrane protein
MGIIQRQTIKGSIYSYAGVAMGFVTVGYLWPRILEPEQIGLLSFLVAVSTILAHLGSLGINSVINRLFPQFRNPKNGHNGFLFLSLIYVSLGALIVLAYYLIFQESIVRNNMEKSFLLAEYKHFIVPFTLATILYNLFDNLHKVIYRAVIGVVVKEFLLRLLNLMLILGYAWFSFRFEWYLNAYFLAFSAPAVILMVSLAFSGEFNLKTNLSIVDHKLRRSIMDVSFFGLIGGMGSLAISNIDKIMINHFIDLETTGIYSIAYLFGTIIILPSRSLGKIATTIIAEAWKRDDRETIREVYSKSSLNQFIFAGLIFLLVWLNVDLVFLIVTEAYASGIYVILFVSLSGMVEMGTGLNGMIIATSTYYRYQSVFIFLLLLLVVFTNWIFIPWLGITGAALASFLSTVIYNAVRAGFIYSKFRMHPFSFRFLYIGGLILAALAVAHFAGGIRSILLRTAVNLLAVALLYALPVYFLKISEDINQTVNRFLGRSFSE